MDSSVDQNQSKPNSLARGMNCWTTYVSDLLIVVKFSVQLATLLR